jgi:hypothetical protein
MLIILKIHNLVILILLILLQGVLGIEGLETVMQEFEEHCKGTSDDTADVELCAGESQFFLTVSMAPFNTVVEVASWVMELKDLEKRGIKYSADLDKTDEVLCAYCLQPAEDPHIIDVPRCGHLFCKDCITTYVNIQVDNNNQEKVRQHALNLPAGH